MAAGRIMAVALSVLFLLAVFCAPAYGAIVPTLPPPPADIDFTFDGQPIGLEHDFQSFIFSDQRNGHLFRVKYDGSTESFCHHDHRTRLTNPLGLHLDIKRQTLYTANTKLDVETGTVRTGEFEPGIVQLDAKSGKPVVRFPLQAYAPSPDVTIGITDVTHDLRGTYLYALDPANGFIMRANLKTRRSELFTASHLLISDTDGPEPRGLAGLEYYSPTMALITTRVSHGGKGSLVRVTGVTRSPGDAEAKEIVLGGRKDVLQGFAPHSIFGSPDTGSFMYTVSAQAVHRVHSSNDWQSGTVVDAFRFSETECRAASEATIVKGQLYVLCSRGVEGLDASTFRVRLVTTTLKDKSEAFVARQQEIRLMAAAAKEKRKRVKDEL